MSSIAPAKPSMLSFLGKGQQRKVILSSYLGSTIEFYDLILYATASAVVFGPVFFSTLDPRAATVASLATFAAAYLARPIGGIVFGHFGDRIGRKKMLMISMAMMGIASFLVGLVPAIPIWGALMLVILRVIQGIAIGGEWGGAALMSLEHADDHNRGLAASFTNAGGPSGAFIGTSALALAALLPQEDFMSWGWRIPFLASLLLLVIGLYIRAQVVESPVFERAMALQEAKDAEKKKNELPLMEVLRRPGTLLVVAFSLIGAFAIQALFSTFGVTYAVEHGVSRPDALWAFAISQLIAAITIPIAAGISDKVGRKPVILVGLIGMLVLAYPVFWLLGSGNWGLVILGFVLALPLCQSCTMGPMAAFLAENFSTTSRYTGASLGYQIASLLGAGFTPVIAASLFAATHGAIWGVLVFLMVGCAISIVVLAGFARESRHRDLVAG
ncbi:MFS transporter [Ammonicoccus fulvus]|uniref:MFS transporter n=1 Tax=Ammonicoccus fulvus TaxID=3138240 RepID=A0ABZ3FWC7_9ACTN